MAPAARQLVLLSRCPVFRALALASLAALWRAVRGRPARADAVLLSIPGLSFTLFRSVASRRGNRGHLLLVDCRAITGDPNLCLSTGLKLGAWRSYK